MTLRSRIYWVGAIAFTVINLAGAVWAAAEQAQIHTDVHVALLLLGGYLVWRLSPKRVASY